MTEEFSAIEELRVSERQVTGDYIKIDDKQLRCAKYSYDFGPTDENYKEHLALRERSINELN